MKLSHTSCAGATLLIFCGIVNAQDDAERVRVSFSDPSRPGVLHVGIVNGSIVVKGGDTKDVLIQTHSRDDEGANEPRSKGLRRLPQQAALNIEEQNNRVEIGAMNGSVGVDIEIQVPARTNLELSTVNDGDIRVEGIDGELEIGNVNGSISLNDVKGSVVAHTVNGSVRAKLLRVTPQKPMAFTSLNGTVDVSLPASVKANLKLRSDNGNVYTDFDLQMLPQSTAPVVEDTRRSGGRYQVKVDKVIYGAVNGGGPEIELRTFNGEVYVRKGS